jgi:hypothetical protein
MRYHIDEGLLFNRYAVPDSLYDVADLLDEDENQGPALKMLKDLALISSALPESHRKAHLARANDNPSLVIAKLGRVAENEECRQRALGLRKELRPDEQSVLLNCK